MGNIRVRGRLKAISVFGGGFCRKLLLFSKKQPKFAKDSANCFKGNMLMILFHVNSALFEITVSTYLKVLVLQSTISNLKVGACSYC